MTQAAKADLQQFRKLQREKAAIRRTLGDVRQVCPAAQAIYDESVRAVEDALALTESRIRMVPDADERALLRYRYICGYSWVKISMIMHYAERTVYNIHGRALQHYANIM